MLCIVCSLQARPGEAPGPLADELVRAELNPNESVHSSDLVRAPQGLFPAPLPPQERAAGAKVRFMLLLLLLCVFVGGRAGGGGAYEFRGPWLLGNKKALSCYGLRAFIPCRPVTQSATQQIAPPAGRLATQCKMLLP